MSRNQPPVNVDRTAGTAVRSLVVGEGKKPGQRVMGQRGGAATVERVPRRDQPRRARAATRPVG